MHIAATHSSVYRRMFIGIWIVLSNKMVLYSTAYVDKMVKKLGLFLSCQNNTSNIIEEAKIRKEE